MAVERPTLSRIWAVNGARYDPGMQKYAQGWTAEIPTYEVLNFLQYRIDMALLAATQRGVPEWGSDMKYEKGALVWDNVNSTIYTAKVASPNQQLRPSANSAQWAISATQFSMEQYHGLQDMINAHLADRGNPHGVTADQANTYTKAVIDQKVGVVASDIAAHAGRKDNPHGVTAAQIGAVPSSGGTYTGQVTFATEEVRINPGAGDHVVKATADRVTLRSGATELGIRKSDGRAVLWKDGVADALLSEPQYVEARKAAEPDYAVPPPDLWLDLLNDIHIRQGTGYSELKRDNASQYVNKLGQTVAAQPGEPCHTREGLRIKWTERNERLEVTAPGNIPTFEEFTWFIEGVWDGAGRAMLYWDNGAMFNYVEVTPEGYCTFNFRNSSGGHATAVAGVARAGEIFRIAAVYAGGTLTTFLNGVQGAQTGLQPAPWGDFPVFSLGCLEHSSAGTWYARSFKTWSVALTPEQISTL